jgi:hypothetical protein
VAGICVRSRPGQLAFRFRLRLSNGTERYGEMESQPLAYVSLRDRKSLGNHRHEVFLLALEVASALKRYRYRSGSTSARRAAVQRDRREARKLHHTLTYAEAVFEGIRCFRAQ